MTPTNAQLDLGALLSPDNTARQAAEQAFRSVQESEPTLLAMELVSNLAPTREAPIRELCAVLLRRELPGMLAMKTVNEMPKMTNDYVQAIKASLLQAVHQCDVPSLRRKLCDTIGRLGAEFLPSGGWPELMAFIQGACSSTDQNAHAVALTMLSYMGPALVQHQIWAGVGSHILSLLVAGLAAGNAAPEVTSASLCALTALLRACAEVEAGLQDGMKAEKKQIKAIAGSLQSALPQMLGCVEQAVNSSDATRLSEVLDNLVEIGNTQPKLFKSVLPQVVEGMSQLAQKNLPVDVRIGCIELLLSIAEGAPKM